MLRLSHITGLLALFAFLLSGTDARGQNLVLNPSFEQYTLCPNDIGQIARCQSWRVPPGHNSSTDYFNACYVPGSGGTYSADVPAHTLGYQWPATGNAYAGIIIGYQQFFEGREYMQGELSQPLVAGIEYQLQMKCAFRDSVHNSNAVGMYLSASPNLPMPSPDNSLAIPVTPQFNPPVTGDSLNWTLVTGSYTAVGGEQYITIGNFRNNANTVGLGYNIPQQVQAYMFVDDVRVIRMTEVTPDDTTVCAGSSVTITADNSTSYAWVAANDPTNILSTDSTLTVSPSVTTTYYVYGSGDTGTVIVNVLPLPHVNLGNDTSICATDVLTLTPNPSPAAGTQYVWQNNVSIGTLSATQTGTYWVQATLNGCTASDTIQVTVNPSPTVGLANSMLLCAGAPLTLDASYPNATYLWQDSSTAATFTATQPGPYSVTVTLGSCSVTGNVNVYQSILPQTDLGNDVLKCAGSSVTLKPNIVAGASYLWSDNSTGTTFSPTQSGNYWVQASMGGCQSADSVDVLFHPLPVAYIGHDTVLCEGSSLVLDATQNGASYQWHDNSTQPTFTVTQTGTYAVQLTNGFQCKNSASVTVSFVDAPHVNFSDTTLCIGERLYLDIGTQGGTYLWQDKSVWPQFTVEREGIYWATVHNACGTDTDTMDVTYERCRCYIYLPNSFTPDENKLNEQWLVAVNPDCPLQAYTLTVFNRWGQIVFETQNIDNLWDGTLHGQKAPIDVYTYHLMYKFENAPHQYVRGSVSLVR